MKKCQNCGISINENRKYCSLKCRNIYVNKNLRDYTKNTIKLKKNNIIKYDNNPKFCLMCGNKIPYNKKRNNFCNHSCSAKYNNKFKKGLKYNLSENGYLNILKSNIKFHEQNMIEYDKNPKKCKCCENYLPFIRRERVFCDNKCKKEFYLRNKTDKEKYKIECKFNFNLKDYPDEFDFTLVEKYGWYKAKNNGDNLNGVSRDHMYSIMEGYKNNIEPKIISHPANCKLMIHNKNIGKGDKCSITIDELIQKINKWDKKYKL